MARDATTGRPSVYAQEKLPTMLARWRSEPGEWARRLAAQWPGLPAPAILALTANSTGPAEAYQDPDQRDFWALGLYQTPGGPDTAPTPNPDPRAPHNAWTRLGRDPRFLATFGRPGTIGSDWSRRIDDQTMIGILDYRDGGVDAARRIGSRLAPTIAGGQWDWALAVLAYVVGSAAAANLVTRNAAAIQSAPEPERLGALARHLATSGASRTDVYPVVRALQRLAVGEQLARAVGLDSAWYDPGLGSERDAIENHLAGVLYGTERGALALTSSSLRYALAGVAGVSLGLLTVLAWARWRR